MSDLPNESPSKISPRLGDMLLIITTILWGSTFIVTNTLTQIIPPMFYMGVRYLLGFLGFLPFLHRLRHFSRKQVKISIIASLLAWVSFATQTYGIQLTTATKSGFITGLNVIMVPIFIALIFRQKVKGKIWISALLALIGVSIFSFGEFGALTFGDVLILICDVFYALYIIYLEYNLNKVDSIGFSIILVFNLSFFSFILSFITEDYSYIFNEGFSIIFTWQNLLIMVYMGIVASSIATLTQTFGQTVVKSTRAAIIYALEPIFAALFAVLLGSEKISIQLFIGGLIIMIGIYISILSNNEKENHQNSEI